MKRLLLQCCMVLSLNITIFGQTILYVDSSAAGGNNGTSWTNAYASLQSALTVSTSGDQIWVAKGTYIPSVEVGGTGDRYKAFQMKNGVALIGGFAGTETDTSQRTAYSAGETHETKLSGDLTGNGWDDNDCYHVINNTPDLGITNSSVLNGFTLINCYTTADSCSAMLNTGASPKIHNCYFGKNYQGIYLKSSSPVIQNCTFKENNRGIYADSSSPVISYCVFDTNNCEQGCGLYLDSSTTEISNCSFTRNGTVYIPTAEGGAIYNIGGSLRITNSSFARNIGIGGGIYNKGTLRITNSTFTKNYGFGSGGAIYSFLGPMHISHCTFDENYIEPRTESEGSGGAIWLVCSFDTISHCTFTGNSTYHNVQGGVGGGGGICVYNSPHLYITATITHCTFSGYGTGEYSSAINTGTGCFPSAIVNNCLFMKNRGDAPVVRIAFNSVFKFYNCTFSGNSSYGIYNDYCDTLIVKNSIFWGSDSIGIFDPAGGNSGLCFVVSHSCVQGGYSGEGNISSDPLFVDTANGDYRLQNGSPCIGTGTTVGAPATDIEDALRGVHISMGAYENNTGDPMPVELASFNAEYRMDGVLLTWQTATEVNNYGFEIERRVVGQIFMSDVIGWSKIGFVAGNGTSNSGHSYSYTDNAASSGTFAYRLKQIDNNGTFKYSQSTELTIAVPKEFTLGQNYPNPFNPSTTIKYDIPLSPFSQKGDQRGFVTLKVYDILGREVATLVNEMKQAGSYEVKFNASKLSSGLYLYKLKAGSFTATKKLILLR